MPITASAKKSLRVSRRRLAENIRVKEAVRGAVRKVDRAKLAQAFSVIDRAAQKGVIHPNKAARLKSTLAKRFGPPEKTKPKTPQKRPTRRPQAKES